MNHGYITVIGQCILLNIDDIIMHLIKQVEGINIVDADIDINDYEIDIYSVLDEFKKIHSKEFNFHYEEQVRIRNVFITLYKKNYQFDAREACGSHYELDLNRLNLNDGELEMFNQIQIKMIGKVICQPKLSAFSYETL
jgi:hypothetical protein